MAEVDRSYRGGREGIINHDTFRQAFIDGGKSNDQESQGEEMMGVSEASIGRIS